MHIYPVSSSHYNYIHTFHTIFNFVVNEYIIFIEELTIEVQIAST